MTSGKHTGFIRLAEKTKIWQLKPNQTFENIHSAWLDDSWIASKVTKEEREKDSVEAQEILESEW